MFKEIRFILSLCLILIFTGCKTKTNEYIPDGELSYNPYVEAFTSGRISRHSPVFIVFNQDIKSEDQKVAELKKLIKITPDIKGEFAFGNNHTVVFKPTKELERNTVYEMTVDLSKWFDITSSDKTFSFNFHTLPLSLRASLESMDISPNNHENYDITYLITSSDKEEPEDIVSLIQTSEKTEKEWEHSADGKRHFLTLKNVAAGKDSKRDLVLSIGANKLGVPQENLLTVSVPAVNQFAVYDIQVITEPERYIEVTFTQPLDEKQNLKGLAYIRGNSSSITTISGNKIHLYPDANQTGNVDVHISKEIKNSKGKKLGENVIETVEIAKALPTVEFIGNGVIIPQSSDLIVPFRSVYLKGVNVKVIKILEQNIGQFLQSNRLDGSSELAKVGRLVAMKTIFLDEDENIDLTNWNTFGVDLRELMEPEQGAIYRVELSFNKHLSAYPCDELEQMTKEELLAENDRQFENEMNRFDNGYYYYGNTYYYYWGDDEDPCSNAYYYYRTIYKNVLASNLGIVAKRGDNNELLVIVNDILTTYPEKSVTISVYNYQNQVIGTATTNDRGQAKLKMNSGKPYYILASKGKQRSYLRIDDGSSLSMSAFDVSGEVIQKGIKGFIYGDRGVWRPGDILHLGFMLNDREKTLPANHPVIMELYNPMDQLYLRKTQTKGELGLYTFDMPTDADALTGTWRAEVKVGGVTFQKRLRVETIKPNRLKIKLTHPQQTLLKGDKLNAPLHVEWLQGATARNLKYDIQGTFLSTPTVFNGFKDFIFDDPTKTFNSEESNLITGETDGKGDAVVEARFEIGSSAPGMLIANLVTRVYEESGDFSIDADRILYSPYRAYAGIKSPQKNKDQLATGRNHTFEVASVDYLGKPLSESEIEIEVYKVNWYWWWSSDRNRLANYISNSHRTPVKEFSVTTNSNGKGTFSLNFSDDEWGTYYIKVTNSENNHSTGLMSYFDWSYSKGRRDREGGEAATTLNFKTDKQTYQPGERMILSIPSSEGSRAIVSIETGTKILFANDYYCQGGETTIQIEVTPEMQPNAYAHITLLQPHANTENDLPIRLYGVTGFNVTSPESHLHPVIKMADEIKPESKYEVTVSEENGKEMAYTLAIVDEGLLDLTRFPTPDPWKAFNAKEALGITTWDLYNYIVGAYGGRIEQVFSIGGDDALNKGPKAIVNRFRPVVQFEGPFYLKKGEKKRHRYTMPNYTGRVRVMVVAGNGSAYGNTEKSVMVRKPVMILGTLPRVIGVGEEMVVPATVFATENNVGKVNVTIACSDNMEIMGSSKQELNFTEKDDKQANFRIRVKNNAGTGRVTLTATGKGDKSVYETDIEIRSVRRAQTKVVSYTLDGGKSLKENLTLPGENGTNKLVLEVSNIPPINLSGRLSYLITYPHGCIEQITSIGFPQLYLKEFVTLSKQQENKTEAAVKEVIRKMRSYQTVHGGFAYWSGGSDINGWATVYATHFLLEAEKKGYLVPENMKKNALNYLRKEARAWSSVPGRYVRSEEMIQGYRLYVLALAQTPEIGAMNRMKEVDQLDPMAQAYLSAAYTLTGRADVGNTLMTTTQNVTHTYNQNDLTFGSNLRDQAILLQSVCLLKKDRESAAFAKEISQALSSDKWYSTQSIAYALMGLSSYIHQYKLGERMEFEYASEKAKDKIKTNKVIWTETLAEKADATIPLEVKNTGTGTLFINAILEGIPEQGKEEAYSNDLEMRVIYTNLKGERIDIDSLEQGTNFKAVVTVKNPTTQAVRNLALTQIFPAGWEILNTRFLNDAAAPESGTQAQKTQTSTQTTSTRDTPGISYQDIRDDRVYTYIDYMPNRGEVTVEINLCAVYPGKFYLPPVYCEAMYNYLVRANTEGLQVEIK